ncbi:MAG TPA: GtrA family protein [bacterium]|nr:GtrA family protein [bacterium]
MIQNNLTLFYNKIADCVRRLNFVRHYPDSKELIKYSIVGNLTNFLDLMLYIAFTRFSHFWYENYLWANTLSMLIGSVLRFFLHKKWTFRHDGGSSHYQYFRFVIVLVLSFFLTGIFLFVIVEHLDFNDIIGKIMAMGLVTGFTYYLTKVWVFRKK